MIFTAVAPSNIAFLKYWGKRSPEMQWPANDSISMTLSASVTTTSVSRTTNNFDQFTLAGKTISSVTHPDDKIFRQVRRIKNNLDLIQNLNLTQNLNSTCGLDISSNNSFPTGCGIASSASGFAALTLATTAALLGESSLDALDQRGVTRHMLAHWARLGSGSAGRSMFGGFVQWTAGGDPTSQLITEEFASDHWDLADVIVVLSDAQKHVSSSEAHLAAWSSPLFKPRLAGVADRLATLKRAISERDLSTLGREIECDALEMHGVALTGSPAVQYFTHDTINFISWVRTERRSGLLPAWFTIDAGPNIHLICRSEDALLVSSHVKTHWPKASLILDRIGTGPELVTSQTAMGASRNRDFSESQHA
jgi:diphosphomevalonate decarboxylase